MIIFRYLARELLATTAAVCAVLMMVIISSRFVKYLAQAAAGKLDADALFAIMGYRMPGFLELILPLAFFLAILLAYGRFYVDSEMTVLHACGVSQRRLLGYTLVVALMVAGTVGWLSIAVSPGGLAKAEDILNQQKQRGELESLVPGRFYSLRGGKGVTYAEEVLEGGSLRDVFLAESGGGNGAGDGLVVVLASRGIPRKSEQTGENYLVLEDGERIQGLAGRRDFRITTFDEYGQRLEKLKPWELRADKSEALSTRELMASDDIKDKAALQWRFSLPVLVIVVSMIAVPLSKTSPRQGRFSKVLPAVMLYIVYLVTLNGARGAMEDGGIPPVAGIWWVHLVFIAVGMLLLAWNAGWRLVRPRDSERQAI